MYIFIYKIEKRVKMIPFTFFRMWSSPLYFDHGHCARENGAHVLSIILHAAYIHKQQESAELTHTVCTAANLLHAIQYRQMITTEISSSCETAVQAEINTFYKFLILFKRRNWIRCHSLVQCSVPVIIIDIF